MGFRGAATWGFKGQQQGFKAQQHGVLRGSNMGFKGAATLIKHLSAFIISCCPLRSHLLTRASSPHIRVYSTVNFAPLRPADFVNFSGRGSTATFPSQFGECVLSNKQMQLS